MVVDLMNDDKAVLIDIRDKETFKNGHILNSIQTNPEDFDTQKMSKYKNKPIVLICSKGIQSQSLASKIKTKGFEPLVLGGGLDAWQNADLPLVKGK
jgi:rhodanese-related sulfurtransferase